jgi:hypothetical protein
MFIGGTVGEKKRERGTHLRQINGKRRQQRDIIVLFLKERKKTREGKGREDNSQLPRSSQLSQGSKGPRVHAPRSKGTSSMPFSLFSAKIIIKSPICPAILQITLISLLTNLYSQYFFFLFA